MATKRQWKTRARKAKARVRKLRKQVAATNEVLADRHARIVQLESVVEGDLATFGPSQEKR